MIAGLLLKVMKVALLKSPNFFYMELFSRQDICKALLAKNEFGQSPLSLAAKKGFRYGDSAAMALIELVDRDEDAKNQDVPVKKIEKEGTNVHLTLSSPFTSELKIDQSLAHNGCCLTVVEINGDEYVVTAIKETIDKTNLSDWSAGTKVNLERCMMMNGRLDGHIVQGHVDTTATLASCEARDGSWNLAFTHGVEDHHLTVQKGSITVNGVSLTVVDAEPGGFSVTIIPYTWEHTGFHALNVGDSVNLEFDVVGKYVARMMAGR